MNPSLKTLPALIPGMVKTVRSAPWQELLAGVQEPVVAYRGDCSTQSWLGAQVPLRQRLAPLSCLSSSQGKDGGQVGGTVPPGSPTAPSSHNQKN